MQPTSPAPSTPPPLPRLRGLPLIGNLLDVRRDRIDLLRRLGAECGDMGTFKVGPRTVYTVASLELAQEIFVDRNVDFKKSAGLSVFGRMVLGDGLLTAEGEAHLRQRRLMAPAFAHKRIAGYAGVMAEYGERAQRAWTDGAIVDVAEEMMRLTLAIVGKTLFDVDVSASAAEVGEALTVVMKWMVRSVSAPIHIPLRWPTPGNRALRHAVADLDRVVYKVIAEHKNTHDRGDVLSMLLLARDESDGTGMSDVQIRDEVMTLMLAGHETTANTLAWSFYLLGRDPAAFARLHDEAAGVLGGRTPTWDDLAALPFALQVIKEAMRLYPPAYMIGREALRPVRIGGHLLPTGAIVFVNVYAMHRRADYFPDPLRFDPERFSPDNEKKLRRGAWSPFGGGPRVCIGNHFALMEGQILLAALAQRVALSPLDDAEAEMEPLVTLRPRGGLRMKVRRFD